MISPSLIYGFGKPVILVLFFIFLPHSSLSITQSPSPLGGRDIVRSQQNGIDDQVKQISHQLMCPVCQGQSVAESNSNLANDMRDIIKKQLREGKSEQEIISYFTDRYGESILGAPPVKGINWALWLLPIVAIALGGIGIGLFLRKSQQPTKKDVSLRSVENKDYLRKIDEELEKRED